MRARLATSILATAYLAISDSISATSAISSSVVTVPLEWVDRQAYVASVLVDSVATRFQIGTMYPYAWLACGLESPTQTGLCQPNRCDAAVYAETNRYCATQRGATLTLESSNGTSGPLFTGANMPLRIAQYHNLTELNDTRVYTPPAMKPDYSAEQPRLVPGAQGVFGLGRGSVASFTTVDTLLRSFSLYVTSKPQGSVLLLDVGPHDQPSESFDPSLVIANGWTAQYAVPLRNASSDDYDDQADAASRWDLSLVGIRFDEDQPLYPRVYTWSEEAGGDAAASLSLNDAVLGMPSDVLNAFQTKYLSSCLYGRENNVGNRYFTCEASLRDSLPRITFYLGNHSFYLDPSDYTHASPKNASSIIVELETSSNRLQWVLGAPFLRKFAARFSAISQDVVLFCTAGVSCRSQSFGTLERAFIQNEETNWTVESSSSDRDRATRYPSTPSAAPYVIDSYRETSPVLLAAIWLGRSLAVLILLIVLIQTAASCRNRLLGRRRGQPPNVSDETGTIASERDIEETKEELRAMAAEEEAQMRSHGTRHFVNDLDADYEMIQSPHHRQQPPHTGRSI